MAELDLSESKLAYLFRGGEEGWPVRMSRPKTLDSLTAGNYLLSTTLSHTDGIRVLSNGSVRFFPSDQRISKFVLTEQHPYVQKLLGQGGLRVIQLVTPQAGKLTKQQKRRRDLERKKLAKKLKKSNMYIPVVRHFPCNPCASFDPLSTPQRFWQL